MADKILHHASSKSISLPDVLKAIGSTLDHAFGYTVYVDEIKQGFEEPCFFIETVKSAQKKIGLTRHQRSQTFCVHFFPDEKQDVNLSILETAEKLYLLLEYIRVYTRKTKLLRVVWKKHDHPIPTGKKWLIGSILCRGTGMHHASDDGMLHFFVDYSYHLLVIPEPDPHMQQLEHETQLRGTPKEM